MMTNSKPVLFVLNKADLSDVDKLEQIVESLKSKDSDSSSKQVLIV